MKYAEVTQFGLSRNWAVYVLARRTQTNLPLADRSDADPLLEENTFDTWAEAIEWANGQVYG